MINELAVALNNKDYKADLSKEIEIYCRGLIYNKLNILKDVKD